MENEPNPESYTSQLLDRIATVRERSLEDVGSNSEFNDAVADFNIQLRGSLEEEYGDSALGTKVPEWHRLVGSTVEIHEIQEDAKRFILDEISNFVESFENKWDV